MKKAVSIKNYQKPLFFSSVKHNKLQKEYIYSFDNKCVFSHYFSAVQVDVFTVVYKKLDSLVSGKLNCLGFLSTNFLDKGVLNQSYLIFCSLVYCTAGKGGERNFRPDGGSDGADSGQHPVSCLPEPASYPQRQGFPTEKVSTHTILYNSYQTAADS